MKRVFFLLFPLALAVVISITYVNTYRQAEVYVDGTLVKTPWRGRVNHHIVILSDSPYITAKLCGVTSFDIRFDDYFEVNVEGDLYTCEWYGVSIPCRTIQITSDGQCTIINATNITGGMSIILSGYVALWA